MNLHPLPSRRRSRSLTTLTFSAMLKDTLPNHLYFKWLKLIHSQRSGMKLLTEPSKIAQKLLYIAVLRTLCKSQSNQLCSTKDSSFEIILIPHLVVHCSGTVSAYYLILLLHVQCSCFFVCVLGLYTLYSHDAGVYNFFYDDDDTVLMIHVVINNFV